MSLRNAVFAKCDRCGEEHEHKSAEEAHRYSVVLTIHGEKITRLPQTADGERLTLCSSCGRDMGRWWESGSIKSAPDKAAK